MTYEYNEERGRNSGNNDSQGGSGRGFASMDSEEQRRIASMGGRAAHEKGTAHEWNSREASEAGRKGGQARGGNSGGSNSSGSDSSSGGSRGNR